MRHSSKHEKLSDDFVSLNINFPWNFSLLSETINLKIVDLHFEKPWNWYYISTKRIQNLDDVCLVINHPQKILPNHRILKLLKENLSMIRPRYEMEKLVDAIRNFEK